MGMYTELIFGASLRTDTPSEVIETLRWMVRDIDTKPEKLAFEEHWIFQCASYSFGVSSPVNKIWYDEIARRWVISTRSNIKNYSINGGGRPIEKFLEWIRPYIASGSGAKEMYAIVTYEESEEPTIYYLEN